MGRTSRRRDIRGFIVAVIVMVLAPAVAAGATEVEPSGSDGAPYPINERLVYTVSWMGIHCGEMEITSFVDSVPGQGPIYRIAVLARTTPFFDGVYRVRSRLDSYFDPRLMSSIRYEEHSLEKKKPKDEVWVVSDDHTEVVRTKNGETSTMPIEVARAFDPLAFVFRLRTIDTEPGHEEVLGLMTSKGAVETVARVTERDTVGTKAGRCDAVAVVPEPRDEMMFSKSGRMVVWIDREPPHRPCRIEFDLSFGTLVAKLREFEEGRGADSIEDWQTWGDR